MSTHEDPAGQGAAKFGQAVAVLAAAAEAFAQLQQARASQRAARDERAAAAARVQLRARHGADRLAWSPLLDPARCQELRVDEALTGWTAARRWPQDPETRTAQQTAEQRLGELRPQAMRGYSDQVAGGADPDQAMRDAGPGLDRAASVSDDTRDMGPMLRELQAVRGLPEQDPQRAAALGEKHRLLDVTGQRTVDGEVVSSHAQVLDQTCYPGALVVEAGAAAAAVAGEGAAQGLHAAVPASLDQGRQA